MNTRPFFSPLRIIREKNKTAWGRGTQLVAIASKRTDLDVCAFHNYHVMTELSCGVLNSPCTLAYLVSQLMQGLFGETALHVACRHGDVDVASLLLCHGAVVDSQDEVRLLYVSMVNVVCHRMVCSILSNVGCHMILSNYHSWPLQ